MYQLEYSGLTLINHVISRNRNYVISRALFFTNVKEKIDRNVLTSQYFN